MDTLVEPPKASFNGSVEGSYKRAFRFFEP